MIRVRLKIYVWAINFDTIFVLFLLDIFLTLKDIGSFIFYVDIKTFGYMHNM